MTDYVQVYLSRVKQMLDEIGRESAPAIHQAAQAVADAVQNGKQFILFGSGHSTFIANDAAYRAGGLAAALAIEDVANGDLERVEGVAPYILARYDLQAGGVMVIISNSGINPMPIEMAQLCKQIGLTVIAITSLSHSQAVPARHSSGKKLYEVADIVIDTHGVRGDAAVEVDGLYVGAMSTIAGSAIVQSITVQAAGLLAERGIRPPVFISANVPEGDDNNNRLLERYRPSLARYPMAVMPGGKKQG